MDSVSLLRADDVGQIAVTASHGALLGGRRDMIVKGPPLGIVFNDAGVGIDRAGIARLPVLDEAGIPAAAVAATSARIGDARSAWESGRLSHVNRLAGSLGAKPGDSTRDLVDLILSHWRASAQRPGEPHR